MPERFGELFPDAYAAPEQVLALSEVSAAAYPGLQGAATTINLA